MELATGDFWDEMWSSVSLPVAVDASNPYIWPIVSTMASYIPPGAQTIIELGGAPGGYLAYFAGRGLFPVALERSAVGCKKTREILAPRAHSRRRARRGAPYSQRRCGRAPTSGA
jgi:hypothetical protein